MKKMMILLFVLAALFSASCSQGPKGSAKLSFSVGYQLTLASNKLKVFAERPGDRREFAVTKENPVITLPVGNWTFYTVEWNGAAPYSGALLCGVSSAVELKSGVEAQVDIYPSEASCGNAFFKSLFDNYCYEPSTTATTTPFRGGSGTLADPYVICSPAQLNAIGGANFSLYSSSHFRLGRDINFHHKFTDVVEPIPFVPIGSSLVSNPTSSTRFNGSFDGSGHSIIGLSFRTETASPTTEVGFVRALHSTGIIKNINFVAPEIDIGSEAPVDKVGVVAGQTFGAAQIENVKVLYGHINGRLYVGGFVGYAYMESMSNVQIKNSSYVAGDVQGRGYTGGLIGAAGSLQGSNIVRSMTSGEVRSNDGYCSNPVYSNQSTCTAGGGTWNEGGDVGGLIGKIESAQGSTPHILESFSTMDVHGMNGVGGLVGKTTSSTTIYITDSYSTGNVYSWGGSTLGVGGIVGYSTGSITPKLTRVFHTQGSVRTASGTPGRLFGYASPSPQCENSFATGPTSQGLNCTPTGLTASTTYSEIRSLTTFQNADWPISTIAAAPPFIEMFAGDSHTCALTIMGELFCWGNNNYGQLGLGNVISRLFPQKIDLGVLYSQVELGAGTSCAITQVGALKCWGYNIEGQIGDGTTTNRYLPTLIDSGNTYNRVTIGYQHTCGISSGVLKCWGKNSNGQLGDGTMTSTSTPTIIDSGTNYTEISAGDNHTCGITNSGTVKCWGLGTSGQLGDGLAATASTPVTASIAASFVSIKAGSTHTCGITTIGELYCWGLNSYGQLGDGTTTQRNTPVLIGNGYQKLAVGQNHTCAINSSNILKCWGNGTNGQLGNSTVVDSSTPTTTADAAIPFALVTAGNMHTCAIQSDGIQKCWGYNMAGQIGDGTTTQRSSPVAINQPPVWLMADNGFDFPQLGWQPPRPCHGLYNASVGSGSAADPYIVCSRAQFNQVASYPNASFRLMNNIDLNDVPQEQSYFNINFNGTLDGNYFSVNGLTVTATTSVAEAGLFKMIDTNGTVTHLKMKGVQVTGDSVSTLYAGAVAAQNYGYIADVRVYTGRLENNLNVGGITGLNLGTISRSSSDVAVYGNNNVGGLVGKNYGGIIEKSRVYGQVQTTASSTAVGGLVGLNYADVTAGSALIDQSASHAHIWLTFSATSTNVGGLVGLNQSSGLYTAGISNSYARANISDSNSTPIVTNVGGLVGNNQGTIDKTWTNSYIYSSTASASIPSSWGLFVGTSTSNSFGSSFLISASATWDNSANAATYNDLTSLIEGISAGQSGDITVYSGWTITGDDVMAEDDPTSVWRLRDKTPELVHTEHDDDGKDFAFYKAILGF